MMHASPSPDAWLPSHAPCRWWGTQGGSWGRDEGTTVFAADSECGNGRVTVTAHPASSNSSSSNSGGGGGGGGQSWEEWRVLRFNDVTRQTVMRVHVTAPSAPAQDSSSGSGSGGGEPRVVAQPDCLAQEYLKAAAAVTAALLGLQRLLPSGSGGQSSGISSSQKSQQQQAQQAPRLRALCIGVGGGSLPLFLAHHFPSMGTLKLRLFCQWTGGRWRTHCWVQQRLTAHL